MMWKVVKGIAENITLTMSVELREHQKTSFITAFAYMHIPQAKEDTL
jgi:hypothetical protein